MRTTGETIKILQQAQEMPSSIEGMLSMLSEALLHCQHIPELQSEILKAIEILGSFRPQK